MGSHNQSNRELLTLTLVSFSEGKAQVRTCFCSKLEEHYCEYLTRFCSPELLIFTLPEMGGGFYNFKISATVLIFLLNYY